MTLNPLQSINKTIHKLECLNYYYYCSVINFSWNFKTNPVPIPFQDIQVKNNCYKSLDWNQVVKISASRMTRIRKTNNNKCWWRCGATPSLLSCWWETGIYPREMKTLVNKKTWTRTFTADLSIIDPNWKWQTQMSISKRKEEVWDLR